MSPSQELARDELRDRSYVPCNTFADPNGNRVEIWTDRKALGPSIMLALNKRGGWELFVQPTVSNAIAHTWTALDAILKDATSPPRPLTHAELEERHELELQREDELDGRSQSSD